MNEPHAHHHATPPDIRLRFAAGALDAGAHILGSCSAGVLVAGLVGPYIAMLGDHAMHPSAILGVALLALAFSAAAGLGAAFLRGLSRTLEDMIPRLRRRPRPMDTTP